MPAPRPPPSRRTSPPTRPPRRMRCCCRTASGLCWARENRKATLTRVGRRKPTLLPLLASSCRCKRLSHASNAIGRQGKLRPPLLHPSPRLEPTSHRPIRRPRPVSFCVTRSWLIYAAESAKNKYPANVVRNQKYNVVSFLPLVLYEQFKFFFNLYFLLVALSQVIPALRIGSLRCLTL
jgi:hypothetical protein